MPLVICVFMVVALVIQTAHSKDYFEDQIEPIFSQENETCRPRFCSNQVMISPAVRAFCDKKNGTVSSRCCFSCSTPHENSTIIGVDYSLCNIEKLANTVGALNKDTVKNITILDVRNNNLTDCGTVEVFAGFLNLDQLYLSKSLSQDLCPCPGGNSSWNVVEDGSCSGRKDWCSSNSTSKCTSFSLCVNNGPGNFLCECKPDYHGYKCLNKGKFPVIEFSVGLSVGTVVLSGLLWHFQRRHVVKID